MAKKNNFKNDIELVVYKCFVRVMKDDGKYLLFRCGVDNTGIMKYLIGKRRTVRSDNPFCNLSEIDDIVKTLANITNTMSKNSGKEKGINSLDKYERVTMAINHLLHFFVECNGFSMDKLCALGETIYSLSCNKLFGDAIEENEQCIINQPQLPPKETMANLHEQFFDAIKTGKISKDTRFSDFLKANIDNLERPLFESNNGHMLGSAPANEILPDDDDFELPQW